MNRFEDGQLVRVRRDEDGADLGGALGMVAMLRRSDSGAWVALVARHPNAHHRFPVEDSRATHVLAYPEDCEAV